MPNFDQVHGGTKHTDDNAVATAFAVARTYYGDALTIVVNPAVGEDKYRFNFNKLYDDARGVEINFTTRQRQAFLDEDIAHFQSHGNIPVAEYLKEVKKYEVEVLQPNITKNLVEYRQRGTDQFEAQIKENEDKRIFDKKSIGTNVDNFSKGYASEANLFSYDSAQDQSTGPSTPPPRLQLISLPIILAADSPTRSHSWSLTKSS